MFKDNLFSVKSFKSLFASFFNWSDSYNFNCFFLFHFTLIKMFILVDTFHINLKLNMLPSLQSDFLTISTVK